MKKLINQIDSVVTEQMEGLIATWPHLPGKLRAPICVVQTNR